MMPALCARCGQELAEGTSACSRCGWAPGAPVEAAPAETAPAAPVAPVAAAGAPPGRFFKPPAPPSAKPEPAAAPVPLELEIPPRRSFTARDGLVMLGGALALVVIWYVSPRLLGRRPAAAPPPVEQAAPAPAVAPMISLSVEERGAATRAINSLKALLDATAAGVKYEDYESRALDAKRQVDPFLLTQGGDAEINRYVREALDLFLLALSTWKLVTQKEWQAIIADPRIELCGPVKATRDGLLASGSVSREQVQALAVANSIPRMWECAAGRLMAAEQVLPAK